MTLTDTEVQKAEKRMQARMRVQPRAVSARYDRHASRIVVTLSKGLDLGVPVRLMQGLICLKIFSCPFVPS
jgi:hypothetical protein